MSDLCIDEVLFSLCSGRRTEIEGRVVGGRSLDGGMAAEFRFVGGGTGGVVVQMQMGIE